MPVEWREVHSGNIDAIAHDPETNSMLVRWKRGKVSSYVGVSPEKVKEAANAWSVTGFVNDVIKPNHEHRYL